MRLLLRFKAARSFYKSDGYRPMMAKDGNGEAGEAGELIMAGVNYRP